MRRFFIFTLIFSILPRLACALEKNAPEADAETRLVEQYAAQGVVSAQKLKQQFEQMDKPAFQKAYDEYLEDLKVISETGKAPDNQALYNDLRRMNSDNELTYNVRKGHVRTGFGHVMRSR